ncbi:uncharacterized protein [Panulirus ornatus]|uniref:uncharacterized protein n=1 Tax=Panulirus ornatus TaxID=150431 RepID=UPI003A8912AE
MRRRDFQEVALSLTAPGTLLREDPPGPSPPAAAAFTIRRQSSLEQQRSPPLHRQRLAHRTGSHQTLSRSSTASTLRESDTDTADYESTPVNDLLASTRPKHCTPTSSSVARTAGQPGAPASSSDLTPTDSSSTKSSLSLVKSDSSVLGRILSSSGIRKTSSGARQKSPRGARACPTPVQHPVRGVTQPQPMEDVGVCERVNGWIADLRAAIQHDTQARHEDALDAYNRLNCQMTKGAIYDYEQLTCDQKKLLGQVLSCLDERAQQLRSSLKGSRGHINKAGFASAAPVSKDHPSGRSEAAALREVTRCVEVLETIKRMGSKARVPVVLVYRERKHRTHHRHQEKGQSNKIVFAKEKRDFLSLLGLPGAMISEKGIDFTVRPNTASVQRRQKEAMKNNNTTETTEVGELEPDEKNGGAAVQTDLDDSESPRTTRKILQQYLPFRKKGSVSPQPDESTTEELDSDTKEEEEFADVRSTLSCDSCSSDESSDTDVEADLATDTAVSEAYVHRESIKPPPFHEMGFTYITLAMEKLGVKNTARLVCPFVRVSVRDQNGELVGAGLVQETAEWEVVNKNYLRAPSLVHLQRPLEEMPQDMAIFLEVRHLKPARGVLSTLCYTFLERRDLSNGDFICELYGPPVDYTRKALSTYTEKAFFLHLEVRLQMAKCEVESLDSQHSINSS